MEASNYILSINIFENAFINRLLFGNTSVQISTVVTFDIHVSCSVSYLISYSMTYKRIVPFLCFIVRLYHNLIIVIIILFADKI